MWLEVRKLLSKRFYCALIVALLLVSLLFFVTGLQPTAERLDPASDVPAPVSQPIENTTESYSTRIQRQIDNTQKKMQMSLFDTAWQKNKAEREIQIWQPLLEITESDADSSGYNALFSNSFTDVLLFVLVWLLLDALFFEDRRLAIDRLLDTTYTGRYRLFANKYVVFAVLLLLFFALFHLLPLIVGLLLNRLPWLPIQMVSGFSGVFYPISAISFYLFLAFGKYLTYLAIGSIVLWLSLRFQRLAYVFGALAVIAGIFLSLFYFIPPSSPLILAKYINPIAFLGAAEALSELRLFNLFNRPFTFTALWFSVNMVILFLMVSLCVLALRRQAPNARHKQAAKLNWQPRSDFAHHLKIVSILQKSIFLLLLLASIFTVRLVDNRMNMVDYEADLHAAMRVYGGKMDAKQDQQINERLERAKFLQARLETLQSIPVLTEVETIERDALRSELQAQFAERGFNQLLETRSARQRDGKQWLLPVRGFGHVFGVYYDLHLQRDFLLSGTLFVFFIAFGYAFFFDGTRHDLIRSTWRGRTPFYRQAMAITVAFAGLFMLLPEVATCAIAHWRSPLLLWSAPLSEVSDIASSMRLWVFYMLKLLVTWQLYILLGLIVFAMLIRSSRDVAIAAGIGFVVVNWLLRQAHGSSVSLFTLLTFDLARQPLASGIKVVFILAACISLARWNRTKLVKAD